MVECTSNSNGNKEILPIFLDVQPDDVKLKTELYSKALSVHQKAFGNEIESWKKALVEVDKIKGWNWRKDEGQEDLMQSIIETVFDKLHVHNKKIVSENLVGVDDRAKAIIKMLDVGSDGVEFLGLHGMGGIGKTTLAKVVFNQLSSHFKDYHFLLDVSELSQCHDLVYLQKQLLSKFVTSHSMLDRIGDLDEGINMIKRVLGNRKVLIVLDDVDEKEQLKSLAKEGNWFGSGSRIIITTRDQSVLRIVGEATGEGHVKKPTKVSIYEVREMKFEDALKLFSRHAFRMDSPPGHYGSLSNEIVSTLGMLPLALEVIGSSLNNESREFWQAMLKKLKDAPPDEVQSKLMISYDKLDNDKKQVFLDIACFFVNEDKTYPFYMWDEYGYHPHVAIKVLILMSLIKIKDDNTFWMHDQVRDLGREIVRKENFDDPYKRSRVWEPKQALSILKRKEGSREIKALSVEFLENSALLEADEFANLEKLRLFRGSKVSFIGDFNNLLSNLRWLSCCDGPSMLEAKNFRPTNLVILKLSRSNISEESIDWIKAARKLKVLDLSGCNNLRSIPNLSTLVSLEILRLRRCRKINKLPDSIGKLQSLMELDLLGTSIDDLPDSFGNLKQLKTLRMSDIEGGMTKLPSAIWLVQLVADPYWCNRENLHLSCLKMPDLSWTQIPRLPTVASLVSNILLKLEMAARDSTRYRDLTWSAVGGLEDVVIPLQNCTQSQMEKRILASPNMRFLRQLPSSLRKLIFRELETLRYYVAITWWITDFWMPIFLGICDSKLEKLLMQDYTFSRRLARFMLKMRRFQFEFLFEYASKIPPQLHHPTIALEPSHMKNLREVDLFECELLVEIRGLEELGSLTSLVVKYCRSIKRIPDLSKSRKLRELQVGKCPKLRSVEGLDRLKSLKRLRIHDCRSLESLADTSNLDLECCLIVRCKRLSHHRNYCKRGRGCYCEMLFERLWKSNPMEVRQLLQGHPNVAPVRKSELDWVVVFGAAVMFVLFLFCYFVF